MTNYHPTVDKIKDILVEKKFWFETFEHVPVTTSEEAARQRPEYQLKQGVKALIVKAKMPDKSKKFIMVCVSGDKKFDSKKLKNVFSIVDTRLATEMEISEITQGVQRGGVPPFGNIFNLPIYADFNIFENEKIIFNAGDRSYSIGMFSKDYKEIVNSQIGDISQ